MRGFCDGFWRGGGGGFGEFWLGGFYFGVCFLDFGFIDQVVFDLDYWGKLASIMPLCNSASSSSSSVPFLRHVPSGKFSGPTSNLVRCFFGLADEVSSSMGLLDAMLV